MEPTIFSGSVTAGNITVIQGENKGPIINNSYDSSRKQLSDEDYISFIISSNSEEDFKKRCKEADDYFKERCQQDIEILVEDIVKRTIDSETKKTSFLDKIKQFSYNIASSIVGGLILQAVNNL